MSEHGPLRSVAVIGGGATAWLAAIALHRAFAPTGMRVALVAMPSAAQPQDALTSLPDLAGFHRLLGLSGRDLIEGAGAGFALGRQFVGWGGADDAFFEPWGETGAPLHNLPFVQLWTRARLGGMRAAFEDFSLAAAAARAGRIAGRPGEMAGTGFGHHLDAQGYEALLARHARGIGLMVLADAAPRAETEAGAIAAIRLSDGRTLQADLYVDATGGEARLIETLDPGGLAGPRSPCDRMLAVSAPPISPLPLHARIVAHRAGWLGLFPLPRRTAIVMAYASAALSDAEALAQIGPLAGLRVAGDAVAGEVDQGLRARPWTGNCVAVGAAAYGCEPLDGIELQRDRIGIAQLIALMPVDRAELAEAAIYNDEVTGHYARLRDFEAAHYRLNRREGEAFWDAARQAPVSDELGWKIALFAERGMVAQYNRESFNSDDWQAALIGHGAVPRHWDPQLDAVPDGEVARALQTMLGDIRTKVEAMPTHAAALARARQA